MAKNLSKEQKACIALVLLQILMAVGFHFYFGGVAPAGDQGRYLNGAENILNGRPLEERQASYLSYVLILAFFKGLGLSLSWVVVFQWALSMVAMVVLFKLSCRLAPYPANLLAPLFFLFTDIQRWSQNILTDSVYISCAIILVYLISELHESDFSWKRAIGAILFGLFTVFVRPNGWSFIPILPITFLLLPNTALKNKVILFLGSAALLFFSARLVSAHSEGKELYLGFALIGEVIWKYPEGRIAMPQPTIELEGTSGLITYIFTYPFSYLKLVFLRIFTELSHYRSFYSGLHNAVTILYMSLSYTFAFVGLYFQRKNFLAKVTLSVCLFHIGIIGITFADWDGRFLMHFFPLILPFASAGFYQLVFLRRLRPVD